MERILQRGPIVAAMSGIAVDANHHFLCSLLALFESPSDPWAHWGRSSFFARNFKGPTVLMVSLRSREGPSVIVEGSSKMSSSCSVESVPSSGTGDML